MTTKIKATDVTLKDEGKFFTMIFNSPKAIKIAKADTQLSANINGNKIDIANESKYNVLAWLVSHNLTSMDF